MSFRAPHESGEERRRGRGLGTFGMDETDGLGGTHPYAVWIAAPFLVVNAVFASTRVAVHDGDY